MMGMEAVVLIGIQGSGKSTFVKERLFDTHVRINLDMLRTRRREAVLLEACLAAGQRFVVDNTNPTAEVRRRYLEAAKARQFRTIGYFFDAPLKECLQRNAQRPGKKAIPPVAVRNAYERLERPRFSEGFDELYEVSIAPEGGFVVEAMRPEKDK
jgi:predicted kinase